MRNQRMRTIVISSALLAASCGLIIFCDWRGNFPDTLRACRKALLAMPVFVIVSGMAHAQAGKGLDCRRYIAQMFCGKETAAQDRKAYLDHARILAAVMVILTHACSMQANEAAAAWKIGLLRALEGIGLVCNPLYVMISGALLLPTGKDESLGDFYWKRFFKVVIPMVAYYVIFLCVSGQVSLVPPRGIAEGAAQILAGASGIVPHYWLIYTLISLYVTAPFVRVMANHLRDDHVAVLFVLILAGEVLGTFLPLTGIRTGFTMQLAGWEGVFLLGYMLAERRQAWMERFVLIAGGVCAAGVACAFASDSPLRESMSNTSPAMVLFAGAVMVGLSKLERIWKNPSPLLVRMLTKYSYSIILVHWYGLFVVTWGKIGFQPLRFGCVGGILITVLTAVVVCFILGFTADNTVVLAVQHIVSRIHARFSASS